MSGRASGDAQVRPIIGLEIHVQLATRTKLFCSCAVEFGASPNSRVCPVCLGLPGALPVINRRAVEFAVRAGLALNCQVAAFTKWDRKSYYYPDLPKNYQISQYDQPLCVGGFFEFPFAHKICKIRIRRAHLEEDAGKNVHNLSGGTGVDLNRTGTPLLEIVTEPDFTGADEAREFAVQLQRLMRYLGVSDADMQKGQMRFEPNINLAITSAGREVRTPIVEVKNLNSFKSLHGAIECEIDRQLEEWRATGVTAESGNKRNRGWDDVREVTVPQREKEEAADYRYFPEPDLPPLTMQATWVASLREHMPELPLPRTDRFVSEFKVSHRDAPALVDDRATADLLDHAAAAGGDKQTLGKHFLSFWAKCANQYETTIAGLGVPVAHMAELANLVATGAISATAAAQIAEVICERIGPHAVPHVVDDGHGGPPAPPVNHALAPQRLAEELGLLQVRDEGQLQAWVVAALAANAEAVSDALSNPKKMQRARGFLTGQVMKLSGGAADPKRVGELLDQHLSGQGGASA